jgi:hypothetical protein
MHIRNEVQINIRLSSLEHDLSFICSVDGHSLRFYIRKRMQSIRPSVRHSIYLSIYLSIYISVYLSIYLSVCLSVYLGLYCPLLDLGRFFSFLLLYTVVGLLGRGISLSQGRYVHMEHKHRIISHRHPRLEWDPNQRPQRSSERRHFML